MQQDQSMEVMEVQDPRDDASLELVPSVGGDDVAADDGYDDGYDGEDPEEEEAAPVNQANHLVNPPQARNANEEEFLPTRLSDVIKGVKEGRLQPEAIAMWFEQNPRTEKESTGIIDHQNINIDQMQLQHGKHVEGLQNKTQDTTAYAQSLSIEGEFGQFTQAHVAPMIHSTLHMVSNAQAVLDAGRGNVSTELYEMSRSCMKEAITKSYELMQALDKVYGKSDKEKKVYEETKRVAGEELRLIAEQRLIATMNSEQQPRVGSATRHFRLNGSRSVKRRRTSSPTPAQ
jgi:hypothetical protein